jgi:MarR family transcriptional regulator, multiple gene regulator MgrA
MHSNLGKRIKQTLPFKNEYIKGIVGLHYLSSEIYEQQQKSLKQHGITVQQYNVLRILRGQYTKPVNITLIKERMLDKMSDASRILDRLIKMGCVTKEQSVMDKRNSEIFITETGLNILKLIDMEEIENKTLLHRLTENEIMLFNEMIHKMLAVD